MTITIAASVPRDGSVSLRWESDARAGSFVLFIVRTGSVPAYTSFQFGGETNSYRIDNLSRHQRYRVCVATPKAGGLECSSWLSVTPRRGLRARRERSAKGVESHLARLSDLKAMPQDRRLSLYWRTTPGFVNRLVLGLHRDGRLLKTIELEPEVRSIALDAERGFELENGRVYVVSLQARFATLDRAAAPQVACAPAAPGEERAANREVPQASLVYPFLSLEPEVRVFEDEDTAEDVVAEPEPLRCCHCKGAVEWEGYRLLCQGCKAEFIPNGLGGFLDLRGLRFGTCRCCLPHKILIKKRGSQSLACNHSGKEHIKMPKTKGYLLIEDLPFGLCQCCRPRRPLLRKKRHIVCSKTSETHRKEARSYVLLPSEPVFDAAAIDSLLDAGLAEICATGISKRRA